MPALFGAQELNLSQFRGVAEDIDPTELPDGMAASALNIDFTGERISKRLGKTPYATPLTGNFPILGLHAYYPKDGSERILLQAGVSGVFADQGDDFGSDLGMSVAGTDAVDFVPFQDRVYIGNYIGGLYRWNGDPSEPAEPVAAPIAPTLSDPTASYRVIQDFSDATDWTSTDADLQVSDLITGGANALELTAVSGAAVGAYIHGPWTYAATVDLSEHSYVEFTLNSAYDGAQFQFGVKDNAGVIVWLDLFAVEKTGAWTTVRVNLGPIDPADRTASTGMAIAFIKPLGGIGYPQSIMFQAAFLSAGFEADTYRYYATHWDETRFYESSPSSVASITLEPEHRTFSIDLQVPYTLDPTVSHVRLYRFRDDAPYEKPLLVVEIPNDSALPTYEDTRSDADLQFDPSAIPLSTQYQIDPPLAKTYSVVGNRMLAGAVVVDGEYRPWSLYLSYYGKPHSFASAQDANDPLAGGFIDLGEKDAIVRIVDVDGSALIFCERSIWSLTGTGWDNFELQKRASVGLDARWSVAVYGRLLLFLAADGVRALALSFGADRPFSTWVVSEPVGNRLRAIPKEYRDRTAFGIDERERLHVSYAAPGSTVNNSAVVLDLQQPGALERGSHPTRSGWTAYSNWGYSVFTSLKRGGGDDGEMLGGDVSVGRVWHIHRDEDGQDIETDNGAAVPWSWSGPVMDAGRGRTDVMVYLAAEFDPAAGQEVTLAAELDRGESTETAVLSLGAATTGIRPLMKRIAGKGRYVQLQVSGEHSVAMKMRSAGFGIYSHVR